MQASELVEKLLDLIGQYGDLEVVNDEEEEVGVEYNNDPNGFGDPVFVIA